MEACDAYRCDGCGVWTPEAIDDGAGRVCLGCVRDAWQLLAQRCGRCRSWDVDVRRGTLRGYHADDAGRLQTHEAAVIIALQASRGGR